MLDFSTFQRPRLRVVVCTPSLAPGGAEMWISTLLRHAQTVKYTGLVIASQSEGINVNGTPTAYCTSSENADETARFVTDKTIEVAKWHGADLIVYWGFVPMPGLRELQVPVLHVSHSSGVEKTAWHEVHMARYGDTKANFLAAVSESASKFFSEKIRKREKVFVVHNGSDIERTRPFLGREEQRNTWGIPQDANVMLFLGRFSREKCPEAVLDALQYLDESWWAVFYGWGILEEQLFTSAANSPAKGRILFPQPRLAALGDVYAAADTLVIPSMTEAFPLVMIEAWQAGLPVICSNFSTINELEREYAGGQDLVWKVPCPPGPKEIVESVGQVSRDDPRVALAQRIAFDSFNATAMVGRWESLFYQCVQEWHEVGVRGMVAR